MSDKLIRAFGATVGDGPRALGFEAFLSNPDGKWILRIDDVVLGDICFDPRTEHLVTQDHRTNFVVQLADSFFATRLVDIDKGLTVVGRREENGVITHLVVNVPSPLVTGARTQTWVKLQKPDGTAFSVVGIPSHGSIYTTNKQPIPVVGWYVDKKWQSTKMAAQVFLTAAGPILSKNGSIHSFVQWTNEALSYMNDPAYKLALVDLQATPIDLGRAELPDDVHVIGTLRVNNFSLLVFALCSDQADMTINFPTSISTREVYFEGFPSQLSCRQTSPVAA